MPNQDDFEKLERELAAAQERVAQLTAVLALETASDPAALYTPLLECFRGVVSAGGAGLTLYHHDRKRLVFEAAVGDGSGGIVGYEVPVTGSQHGLAFATGDVQASRPLHAEIEAAAGTQFDSVLVAPLIIGEEPVGTLSAVNKTGGGGFQVGDIDAAAHFAEVAARLVGYVSRLKTAAAAMDSGESGSEVDPAEKKLYALVGGLARLKQRDEQWLEHFQLLVSSAEKMKP